MASGKLGRGWALALCVIPWVGAPASCGCLDRGDSVVVQNQRLTMALSKAHRGAITSLIDTASGRELVASQRHPRLFRLVFSRADDPQRERIDVSSTQADSVQFDVTSATTRVQLDNLAGARVDVTCSVSADDADGLVRWRLSAEYPDALVLEEVQFPFIVLRCPVQEGAGDDAVVLGRTKGGVHHGVSAWKPNTRLSARQPGSLAAQFACYYDAAGGVLTACLDASGYPKTFECRRVAEGLEMDWDHHCFAPGSFEMDYEVALTSFNSPDAGRSTNWRDGADIYKQWAQKQPWCARTFAQRDDVPDWLKSGPAMVRFGRSWLGQPELIRRWLTEYWAKHFPDPPHLITAYWGWEKVASWVTPDYFPVYPSDEEFSGLVAANRQLDCHAFPWPSGYHYTVTYGKREDGSFTWDDRERFARTAEAHAARTRDGSLYLRRASWLQGGDNASMCPGDPWTLDWLNDIGVGLVRRGADMVQVDQVVGGAFPWCYSPSHGHPPGPGLWMTQVFRRQLVTMLDKLRAIDPEAVVCFEEPNEHFIQQAAIQDYRDWEVLRWAGTSVEPASVFNYLYHEYLPTFQSNPRAGDKLMYAYCLVNGQLPHMVPSKLVGAGPALFNGGFEDWAGQAPTGWDKVDGYKGQVWHGKCFHDADVAHEGRASLRLQNTSDDEVVQVSQNVPVGGQFHVGGKYRVSVRIRSSSLAKDNALMLGTFTSQMRHTGGGTIGIPRDTAQEWVTGEATLSVPEGSNLLRLMLHLEGPGTVWLDDMAMEQILPDGTRKPVARAETPPDHALIARWVDLFHGRGRPYLQHGRMLHPPGLEVDSVERLGRQFPAILHNAFRAPDGSEALVAVNVTDEPREAALTWRGRREKLSMAPWEIRLTTDAG